MLSQWVSTRFFQVTVIFFPGYNGLMSDRDLQIIRSCCWYFYVSTSPSTDLLRAGLEEVAQMFHQFCKRGPVCGAIQPTVQHGLVSTNILLVWCQSLCITILIVRCCCFFFFSFLTFQLWHILEVSSWCPPSASCRKSHQCKHQDTAMLLKTFHGQI